MKSNAIKMWASTVILFALFILTIEYFNIIENALKLFIESKDIFVERFTLQEAAGQHILIVGVSSFFSVLIALMIAMLTRFSFMAEFKEFLLSIATFGQTIPTVALLALVVPFLGYGFKPILFALFVYGILPVLRNTIEGFNIALGETTESAKAVGMNKLQVFLKVELPLALPAILAGIRTSVIINISVATIGATVGVNGFGTLIVNGIRSNDMIMLLKGAVPVSLLALAVDSLFVSLENSVTLRMKGNSNGNSMLRRARKNHPRLSHQTPQVL
jgi:osmoprotectant transport system permease protein